MNMNCHAGSLALASLIVRMVRRAITAVRQRPRGQITALSRDALGRDGFSIDHRHPHFERGFR